MNHSTEVDVAVGAGERISDVAMNLRVSSGSFLYSRHGGEIVEHSGECGCAAPPQNTRGGFGDTSAKSEQRCCISDPTAMSQYGMKWGMGGGTAA